jgi:hypothetical protein
LLWEKKADANRTHPNITPLKLSSSYSTEKMPEVPDAENETGTKNNNEDNNIVSDSDESEVPGTPLY